MVALLGFVHTYVYMPYHTRKLLDTPEFKEMVRKRVDQDMREHRLRDVSFELKLSEETDIPLYQIPRKVAGVIRMADSAKKMYPEIELYGKMIPIGLILNKGRLMYVDHKGRYRYPEEDEKGFYRYTSTEKKDYLYLK